jgi:hypothetical protein
LSSTMKKEEMSFWNMSSSFCPEKGGSTFLWNHWKPSPD